jgi:hypothetical protein
MYRDHNADADAAIESLKVGPYSPIRSNLSDCVEILIDSREGFHHRAGELEMLGPMCLWDVSAITDFTDACACTLSLGIMTTGFTSDLFWDTRSAKVMTRMFSRNAQFKGYIGTWDVRNVHNMGAMFDNAGIEDSGIANWNTASLTDASSMFVGTRHLSASLDLSGWKFGSNPVMAFMFDGSSIVDCGIGKWSVANAAVYNMLEDANKFTGYSSLKEPNWPEKKRDDASVPLGQQRDFRYFGSGFGSVATAHTRIARVLADALRNPERGRPPGSFS